MISKRINGTTFEIIKGDITQQETEAIVNAANKRLAPGGGVAGAIHKASGPQLYEECKKLGRCETGEAKITSGYDLKADYVIHTVGPVYSGNKEDVENLKNSYRNSLKLAVDKRIESISFPAISTGAFGYPVGEAAEIAINEIKDFLERNEDLDLVRLVLYSKKDYEVHKKKFRKLFKL